MIQIKTFFKNLQNCIYKSLEYFWVEMVNVIFFTSVLVQPTYCFGSTDLLFWFNRPIVLVQSTYSFSLTNPLFWFNLPIVLVQPTYCFGHPTYWFNLYKKYRDQLQFSWFLLSEAQCLIKKYKH